ncbi:MAG: recombinase family protein [Oscillospiraceae bacterium]
MCASNNLMPVQVFSDAGFSGNVMERPAFQEMLQQIEAGNVSAVVVCNLSRLSRNTKDVCYLFETLFAPQSVSLYSVQEGNITMRMSRFPLSFGKGANGNASNIYGV